MRLRLDCSAIIVRLGLSLIVRRIDSILCGMHTVPPDELTWIARSSELQVVSYAKTRLPDGPSLFFDQLAVLRC